MGVPWMKRSMALKGSQSQKLRIEDGTVLLEMTDARGTQLHEMIPNGKPLSGYGSCKMPCERIVVWDKDGTLVMTERYREHLGGSEHGEPCEGESCPLVRSKRYVREGEMVVEVQRQLLSGEIVSAKTFFTRKKEKPPCR